MEDKRYEYLRGTRLGESNVAAFIRRDDSGEISCRLKLEDFMSESDVVDVVLPGEPQGSKTKKYSKDEKNTDRKHKPAQRGGNSYTLTASTDSAFAELYLPVE